MTVPQVRAETVGVLQATLQALVTEAPGYSSAENNQRTRAWRDAKELYELRARWLKDGYSESTETKNRIEHWYRLLSAIYDPRAV